MSSPPLAFAPHLGAHLISEDEVLLLSERDRFALGGRVHAALVPLLDGSRSADEIAAELVGEHSPHLVHLALIRLQQRGHVVDAGRARAGAGAGDGRVPPPSLPPPSLPPPLLTGAREPHVVVPACAWRGVVEVVGLPASWGRSLEEAVGDAAENGGSGPGLTACLVDDYLRPQLGAITVAALQRGDALLPIRPVGRWLWFGPLLRGRASRPTWELFDERLRMNRFADLVALARGAELPLFPDDRVAATAELAISIAAALLARIVEGVPPPELSDAMLTYDTLEGRFEHHVLARIAPRRVDPAPEFGDPTAPIELRDAPTCVGHDGGHRTCPASETLARLDRFVSPITGIISGVEPLPGLGGMHVFSAVHVQAPHATQAEGRAAGRKGGANGKGSREDQARASCLAEAIERYSGGFFGDEPRRRGRLAEIAEIAFAPEQLLLFSEAQYADAGKAIDPQAAEAVPARFDAAQAIEWAPLSSLITGETRWLPAAYCYYGYGTSNAGGYRGQPYCVADSNGCASGNTLEEAILQGLMELIERDACGLAWYNRARRPEIDLDSFAGEPFAPVREALAGRGRELHVLDLRTDTQVAVALAVAWNGTDGLAARFALGCHLDPRIAVSRALSELAQLEQPEAQGAPGAEPFASSSIHDQPNLIPLDRPPVQACELPNLARADIKEELHWCCAMLAEIGLDVLILDQTRPEVGFPTVRVVIPGLRHFWRRLAPGRLYDAPVKLGWVQRALAEEQLNPLSVLI